MEEKNFVEMTAEERALFEQFKANQAKKEAERKAKEDRKLYRRMVDEEIECAVPELKQLSSDIGVAKQKVFENFKSILEMKADILRLTRDDQRSHTFTNSSGDKRIILGVYVTDGYLDTAEDGVSIVKEYIESLANNEETQYLVRIVLRLLSRDAKGTLKASRIVQLRKLAEETGNDRFLEGVRIIEEAYQPAISRQYIKAEAKDENGVWRNIPLGMTEV